MKLTLKPRTLVISFTSQLQRSSVWSPTWYSLSVRVILYFLGSNKAELWKCWSAVSVAHRKANAAAANFRQWCVVIRDKREKVGVRLSRHSTRSTKSWATLGCLTADKSLTAKPQSLWRSLQVLRCVFQSCGLQKKKNKWDKLEKLRNPVFMITSNDSNWFKQCFASMNLDDVGVVLSDGHLLFRHVLSFPKRLSENVPSCG